MPAASPAPPSVVFALTGDVRRNTRALRQLRALAGLGCQVEVLTLGPPAVGPPLAEGVRLHVIPYPKGSGPSFFFRIHRLFSRAARALRAEVYHASDLYTLPALRAAARRHGGRLVYDARELYPYVASTVGRPWVRRFWRAVEGRHIRHADAVFTVSESIATHLAEAYRLAPPTVLYNAPPRRTVPRTDALRRRAGVPEGTALILHQGQMRRHRGGDRLIEAMADVERAVLVFLGDGPHQPALAALTERLGLADRVRFLDAVPPDALLPLTAGADVGVTLLEDTCLNHRFALPNKLFEYLMVGVPVLASDLPEVRAVVAGFDVGRVVDPADRVALAATLQSMVDAPEARARWAARTSRVFEEYGWEHAATRFLAHYRALLGLPA